MEETILVLKNITKRFPGVVALDDVSVSFRKGEIHALAGENGAGKSTLGSIIAGIRRADSGKTFLSGKEVHFLNALEAKRNRISLVQQHFSLFPELTVAENLLLGQEEMIGKWRIDSRKLLAKANEVLDNIGLEIEPRKMVKDLSPAEQKMVEVAKAVVTPPEVLIMDEPTAALPESATKQLFSLLRNLRNEGTTVIYISHRLDEIFEICDRVTILKDGVKIKTLNIEETDKNELIRLMVGRELGNMFPEKHESCGREILKAENIYTPVVKDVSFALREGEILGLAGIQGQGQRSLIRALFGLETILSGKILLHGTEVKIRNPRDAVRHNLAFVPDSREKEGLALILSLRENMALSSLEERQKAGFIQLKRERAEIQRVKEQLLVKTDDIEDEVAYLSGGNQQKAVIGKWLLTNPAVLILDEPTRGVDVGAKAEIYELLRKFAAQGKGIIVLSTDLLEIVGLCDRVLIIRNGRIVDEVKGHEIEEERIIRSAIG